MSQHLLGERGDELSDLTRAEILESLERANTFAMRIPSHYKDDKAKAHATINMWLDELDRIKVDG